MLARRHIIRNASDPERKAATENELSDEKKSRRRHLRYYLWPKLMALTALLLATAILMTHFRSPVEVYLVLTQSLQERQKHNDEAVSISTKDGDEAVSISPNSDTGDDSCDNILLYLQDTFARNGIGCQLNNYILAIIMATYTNRSLVVLSDRKIKTYSRLHARTFSTSQFGCPSGNETLDDANLPFGLSRILENPDWASRGCRVPCLESYTYADWLKISNNKSALDIPCMVDGRTISVLPLDSEGIRNLAYFKTLHFHETEAIHISYTEFYKRVGASPTEIESLLGDGKLHWSNKHLWDQVMSLLNRKGLLTFQPWVQKDVAERIKRIPLPPNFIAVHIRRGDKLQYEAKNFVAHHWKQRGYNQTTQPTNYVPFAHYMEKLENNDKNITTVYVATDDPTTVQQEIQNFTNTRGFDIVMNPDQSSSTGHLHAQVDCQERYRKTIAAITDLVILKRADMFVGEYSSNWGRFLRTWRTSLVNNTVGTGEPRDTHSVFGKWEFPGW